MAIQKVLDAAWSAISKVGDVAKASISKVSGVDASGYTGILDTYTGAGCGYSVRKLRAAYSGSCLRVVRSSDASEQDIGFDGSGYIDTAALSSFIGSNTGYVGKWYDQSGTTLDAIGSGYPTQTNLPEIVISGTTQTLNGKVAIKFSGTRRFAWTNTGVDLSALMTFSPKATMMMFVGQIGSTNTSPILMEYIENQTQNDYLSLYESSSTVYIDFGAGSAAMGVSFTNSAQKCWYGQVNGSAYTVYENNSQTGTATNSGAQTLSGTGIQGKVGGGGSSNSNIDGYLQEMIVWPTSQESNRSGIFTNVDTYYSIP